MNTSAPATATMTTPDGYTSLSHRLTQKDFSETDCRLALRGEAIPENLANNVARLCLVSGIREHYEFACSASVQDLCEIEGQEVFARARNARFIMSGNIPGPEMMGDIKKYPYCIWYPDIAVGGQGTYRKLVAAFPDMRYQVGRACAVAGFLELYLELDLLPDVSIAEEAREAARNGSTRSRGIFEHIMATPVRYKVMDDYTLTVNLDAPKAGAFLNADTAVCSTLEGRKGFCEGLSPWRHFNITEDWGVSEVSTKVEVAILNDEEAALLGMPLPFNLPTIHKDLLILAAACDGNVDRYVRLRRPRGSITGELHCLVSGTYKSTAMALWLERNPEVMHTVAAAWDEDEVSSLRRAIYARHVMNNGISRLLRTDPRVPEEELPYWIWYPTLPSSQTLVALAQVRPGMRQQCVRACMAGGYKLAYDQIMNMPAPNQGSRLEEEGDDEDTCIPLAADPILIYQAMTSHERDYFLGDMQRRREDSGVQLERIQHSERWKRRNPWTCADESENDLPGFLKDHVFSIAYIDQGCGFFEPSLGEAGLGKIRRYLSSSEEERERAKRQVWGYFNVTDS